MAESPQMPVPRHERGSLWVKSITLLLEIPAQGGEH